MSEQQDQNDLQSNMAIKMLQDLFNQKKISKEVFESNKERFYRLNDTIMKIFQNQKVLPNKAKKMTQELKFKKEEFDIANSRNDDSESQVKKSQSEVKKAEQEEELMKKVNEQLEMEYQLQHTKIEDQKQRIVEEENEKKAQNQPLEDELNSQKNKIEEEVKKQKQIIDNYEKKQKEGNLTTQRLKKENENIMAELDTLKEEKANIHGRPLQFQKEAERRQNALKSLNSDLQQIKDNILKVDKNIEDQKHKTSLRNQKIYEVEKTVKTLTDINLDLKKQLGKVKYEYDRLRQSLQEQWENKKTLEIKQDELEKEIRRINDANLNPLRKNISSNKKQYKKAESEIAQLKDHIRELEMSIDKFAKEESELKYEISKQEEMIINIKEEATISEYKKRQVIQKTEAKQVRKESIEQQNQDFEQQLAALQEFESSALKKVKMLTAMRESMARKASSAMAEVRETREELKIKELLILDLTKKHQETEFKLNSFKALYEEVKSARNKYVNLIQNSSQHLAELKERIKILQNELEILKNESQEKDSTLVQYKHILQQEVHKRDRVKQKLNKRNFLMRSKKQQVDQNINEIEKLNMIIMAIEKEMLTLRKQYEQACESRNYTGIQLIDRNDELCILYEKANIQENILKNGEQEIKKLEDEIRMIKIEINEKKRQIDVARKLILQVPILADKVIELKNTLEIEQEKDFKLSEEIENPENTKRWRELSGEDPDSEALEAKIHVIEERLNNKKEQLLEKELILDEITNLSEKLRKQALEGRQNTLELSEKLNDFQARLKEITRKMMASISELSMFQATEIKLQQERDELDKLNEEATRRMNAGMPPTPETEIEYLKQVRDNKRYKEEKSFRQQREALEKNFPPFATKTTAEHRVNAYIPDDLAIPKPYGKHTPFKPSEIGANIRHFRKPVIKEIEI